MGGVGSFTRQNRTIYIGRIHVTDDIEEIVARHFAEWGQIERTRVLNTRGVAFVTYSNEANAQFAKESMAHQYVSYLKKNPSRPRLICAQVPRPQRNLERPVGDSRSKPDGAEARGEKD